jgi:hypothetical protein
LVVTEDAPVMRVIQHRAASEPGEVFSPIAGEGYLNCLTVGTLCGFAAWLVFWVLDGNVSGGIAALIALVVAGLSLVLSRVAGASAYALEIGSLATFLVLTMLSLVVNGPVIEPWAPTVSYVGLFATAVVCAVTGRPLVRELAVGGPPTDPSRSDEFVPMRATVTRIWVGAAAGMAVVSAVPAIALGSVTPHDSRSVLGAACLWVVPTVLFFAAAFASRGRYERAVAAAASPGVVRRTSFVAFRELAIDELYYLAREKVEREVGAGMEAYDVNIGSAGVPLTGDESRESWPATYKVRERR